MKLQIRGTTECFHVEHGIGKVLLTIAPDKIALYIEPAPVIDPEVKWSLVGSYDRDLFFNAECPVCHNVVTFAEPSTPFRHCARLDYAPDDLAAKLRAQVMQKKPVRKVPQSGQVVTLD